MGSNDRDTVGRSGGRAATLTEETRRQSWTTPAPETAAGPRSGGRGARSEAAPVAALEEPTRRDAGREASATEWAMVLLRVGAGLLFMQHGVQKLFGMFGGMGPEGGTAPLISQMGLAGVLEVFGGAAIVLGLLTRPIALLLVVEMLWAYVQAHLPQGFVPIQNGGELALLYALIFALLAAHGGGRWSVDRRLARDGTARA